jgi:7-cyano-7-deazaguanine synthase
MGEFSPSAPRFSTSAVLLSGGLDSAVLLFDEASRGAVQPIYVSVGLAWEAAERAVVERLLAHPAIAQRVRPLASLSVDMRDVYAATHWAVEGRPPGYHTPDEDVYLPGRNIILFSKAAVFCAAARISRIAIGTLAHNPFPDATVEFRAALARSLSLGLDWPIEIAAPFADVEKSAVVARGAPLGVPFADTLSCMNPPAFALRATGGKPVETRAPSIEPRAVRHCGVCSKCRERHNAFVAAGVADPTEYVDSRYVRA